MTDGSERASRRHPSGTSTPRGRARRCSWTAFMSDVSRGPRARSGSTPASMSPRPTRGRSCTPRSATRAPATPASCCTASRASSLTRAGSSAELTTDNGSEFRARDFQAAVSALGARQRFIRAGRPNSNGCVERVQLTILEECWRPAFARSLVPKMTALSQDLSGYLQQYNYDRAHTGRLTQGRVPADIVYGARKTTTVR
jgi:Integrase core domain